MNKKEFVAEHVKSFTSRVEHELESSAIRGIDNLIMDKLFPFAIHKLKTKIGYEIIYSTEEDFSIFAKLKKYDEESFKKAAMKRYGTIEVLKPITYLIKKPECIVQVKNIIALPKSGEDCRVELFFVGPRAKEELEIFKATEECFVEDRKKYISFLSPINNPGGEIFYSASLLPKKDKKYIYTEEDAVNKMLDYIDRRDKNKAILDKMSIASQIGFLLKGEPGTGKTSIVKALASELDCPIFALSQTRIKSSLKQINLKRREYRTKHFIILIEEIDKTFGDGMARTPEQQENETDLLQFLDGALTIDNAIVIATTNYIERLDLNKIRAGRFDLTINVGKISKKLATQMATDFGYPNYVNDVYPDTEWFNPSELQSELIDVTLGKDPSERVIKITPLSCANSLNEELEYTSTDDDENYNFTDWEDYEDDIEELYDDVEELYENDED